MSKHGPVEKKQSSIMVQSHHYLDHDCEMLEKEVLQREQKRKAGKDQPLQRRRRGRTGPLPGEIKSGCWECFPRERAWLCCKFPLRPFLKWLNNPKSFAMYFSFHILFVLPACLGQLSLTQRRHSSSGIQVNGIPSLLGPCVSCPTV